MPAEAVPGISSCGTDLRLRAEKQQEPPSTVFRPIPNHADAADQNNFGLLPATSDGASTSSHPQIASGLLHKSVSPPNRLQTSNSGLNGQTTAGRHQPEPSFVAGRSSLIASPSQPVADLQRSMSPPIRLLQPTAEPSVSFRSMSPPISLQNRPSPSPTGQHRSMPSPISPQQPSFQRATSPLASPPPHQSTIQQRRAPSSAVTVEPGKTEKTTTHLSDDKTSSRKSSSSSDQSFSVAASGYGRRPFAPSSVFQQQQSQPPAPSTAVSSTTLQMGSERTTATAYGRRQEASPSLTDHDQTSDQRSPQTKHPVETPEGRNCDSEVSHTTYHRH